MRDVLLFLLILLLCFGRSTPTQAQTDRSSEFRPEAVWQPAAADRYGASHDLGNGHPGPQYWQNHVDYRIDTRLDTSANVLRGSVEYTYTNNSPTPLHSIWIITGRSSNRELIDGSDPTPQSSPIHIDNVSVVSEKQGIASTAASGNRRQIRLLNPVSAHGDTVKITLDYQVSISFEGDLPTRMSTPGGVMYEIGHWFPRVAAYSKRHGWAEAPAQTPATALAEYGSFNYSLTLPSELIVAGSGTLMNPDAVLTSDQRRRLMRARDSERKVAIITPDQAGTTDTRPKQGGQITWKFQMNGVRDVAWAASPSFIWNAARFERKEQRDGLVMSYYPRSSMGGEAWNRSTAHMQKTMEFFSKQLPPYPWNTSINVAGPVGNRSFPGLSFCSATSTGPRLFSCTAQNVSRNWFSVMVGTNTERHPWMTEGLSTAMSVLAHRSLYEGEFAPKQDSTFAPEGASPAQGLRSVMTDPESPSILTPPVLQRTRWRTTLASYKPAYGFLLLREYVLSPREFDDALHQYIQRWAYRQPAPADFFNSIEDATGTDLSWFWTGWFNRAWAIDQAVTDISYRNGTPEEGASITLQLYRRLPMPVKLKVSEVDGDTHRLHLPVEIWKKGSPHTLHLHTDSRLKSVLADPDYQLPDVRRKNNRWSSKE